MINTIVLDEEMIMTKGAFCAENNRSRLNNLQTSKFLFVFA